MLASLTVNGVRYSITRERREAVVKLTALEEDTVLREKVYLDTELIDRALRLELQGYELLKLATWG